MLGQQNETDTGIEPQDVGAVGLKCKRIPKNNAKKPLELESSPSLKEYEE